MYHSRKQAQKARRLRKAVLAAALLLVTMTAAMALQPAAREQPPTCFIQYHDQTFPAEAAGETAAELLHRMGLALTEEDVLSPAADTPMQPGMTLTVDRIQTRVETFTLTIPAETLYIPDSSLPEGAEKLLSPGRDGELRCTAVVRYVNGLEAERRYLSQETVIPAEERIMAKGCSAEDPDGLVIGRDYIRLPGGLLMTFTGTAALSASAYTHTDLFRSKLTALGSAVHRGTAAVDPARIPLGTRMFLVSADGSQVYGIARAEDTLAGTEGTDLELYFPTVGECMDFGNRMCMVYFLG